MKENDFVIMQALMDNIMSIVDTVVLARFFDGKKRNVESSYVNFFIENMLINTCGNFIQRLTNHDKPEAFDNNVERFIDGLKHWVEHAKETREVEKKETH